MYTNLSCVSMSTFQFPYPCHRNNAHNFILTKVLGYEPGCATDVDFDRWLVSEGNTKDWELVKEKTHKKIASL